MFPEGGSKKSEKFVAARMGAQPVDCADLTVHVVPAIEDAHALRAFLKAAAQRSRRNVAAEDHDVVGTLDALNEMMQNPAEFARWAGGDDDAWAGLRIDFFTVLG